MSSRNRRLLLLSRLGAALMAVASLIVALEIAALATGRPDPSPLLYGTLAVAALGSLAGIVLTIAPAHWWQRMFDTIGAFRTRVESAPVPRGKRAGVLLIVVALVAWLTIAGAFLTLPRSPEGNDQGAYLDTAREVHRAGGIPALLRQLYTGEFAEANRHPLYIGLLSFRPTFEAGTVLSLAIGGLALVVLPALVARTFGSLVGGFFAVLLATNSAFCYATTLVTCEGLLVLWTGLAWLALEKPRGDKQPACLPASTDSALSRSYSRAALIGAILGLAWLTKGTGLLLLAGVILWKLLDSLIAHGRWAVGPSIATRFSHTALWFAILLVVWAIVGSPLLARNIQRFGSPTYNVNSYLLFADEYEHPEELAEEMPVGQAARRYLETHTIGDVVRRELRGLAWEAFIICRTLGPSPLDDSRVLFGGPLLALAGLGLLAERRPAGLLVVIWVALFWVMFAWYVPIAAGDRFVLPLAVPVLAYAAAGATRLWQACHLSGARLAALAFVWSLVWSAASWLWLRSG